MSQLARVVSLTSAQYRIPDPIGYNDMYKNRPFFIFGRSVASVGLAALTGCALFPQGPSISEPPIAYVWPTPRCPSQPVPPTYEQLHGPGRADFILGGALASVALGEVAATVFGIPSVFLSQAAKADQAGYTVNSTNLRYYYTDDTDRSDPAYVDHAVLKKMLLAPPRCYVIAIFKSADVRVKTPQSWCDKDDFKNSLEKTCFPDGQKLLDALYLLEPSASDKSNGSQKTTSLRVPDMYIEIGFDELGQVVAKTPAAKAGDPASKDNTFNATIVIPKPMAMYYPAALLTKWSRKSRSLAIAVSVSQVAAYGGSKEIAGMSNVTTNAAATAGLLNVGFTLNLNAEEPGKSDSSRDLAPYPQQAYLLPGLRDTVDVEMPADDSTSPQTIALDRLPINAVVTVHEVGDPSIFLAALAGATQSAGSDYSKAVVSAVLPPPGTQTLGQVVQKNNATVTSAVGTYYKDFASYQKECGNTSLSDQTKEDAYLAQLWNIVMQDYVAAGQIAASFGLTTGLAAPVQPLPCPVKKSS